MATKKQSAGIVLFRMDKKQVEIFLVHPGGPFFAKKDAGAWSIPKGEFTEEENPLAAAKREFFEETGQKAEGNFLPLTPIKQKGGKIVSAWAVEGDIDAETIQSNTFSIQWPPGSGRQKEFPEVDKAGWFSFSDAKEKINQSQAALLDELIILIDQKS
ncbi:MAG: NUDIX domain-containing protein [Bacteroidia bacterium]